MVLHQVEIALGLPSSAIDPVRLPRRRTQAVIVYIYICIYICIYIYMKIHFLCHIIDIYTYIHIYIYITFYVFAYLYLYIYIYIMRTCGLREGLDPTKSGSIPLQFPGPWPLSLQNRKSRPKSSTPQNPQRKTAKAPEPWRRPPWLL